MYILACVWYAFVFTCNRIGLESLAFAAELAHVGRPGTASGCPDCLRRVTAERGFWTVGPILRVLASVRSSVSLPGNRAPIEDLVTTDLTSSAICTSGTV